MDRSEFIRSVLVLPAVASGLSGDSYQDAFEGGVRRLSRDRNFTVWSPDMEPAYRVKSGE
jgi:hypothetical protein